MAKATVLSFSSNWAAEGLWLADYHGLVAVRGGYVSTFSVAKPMARTGRVDLLFTRLAG